MSLINKDPDLYTVYRIGILKQRIFELKTKNEQNYTDNLQLSMYEEELSAFQHLFELMKEKRVAQYS